jgi:hypothetical protein
MLVGFMKAYKNLLWCSFEVVLPGVPPAQTKASLDDF